MRLHPEIEDDQTLEILEVIYDARGTEIKLKEIESRIELMYLKRLNNWFKFFNHNYIDSICIYANTIRSLIDATFNNPLFRTQTTHEFQLSLEFYRIIFRSRRYIHFDQEKSAYQLLMISLIFGKYPGMLKSSIPKSLIILENCVTEDKLNLFFKQLFVQYENPTILTNHINLLSLVEIDVLMFVLKGNSIRKHPQLPYLISKKEAHLFTNNIPETLSFEDNILKRAIIFIKLLMVNPNKNKLLETLLSSSDSFNNNLDVFYSHIDFWKKAFFLIIGIQEHYGNLRVQECVDYFEYMKYINNLNYTLKGKTPRSVSNAIHQWHDNAGFERKKSLIKLDWGKTSSPDNIINEESSQYIIREITNGKDLLLESEKLKHCVFSYAERCYKGHISIWSLRKKVDSKFEHLLTIEVRHKSICQIAGKRNRRATESEFNIIKKWAESKDYDIGEFLNIGW